MKKILFLLSEYGVSRVAARQMIVPAVSFSPEKPGGSEARIVR